MTLKFEFSELHWLITIKLIVNFNDSHGKVKNVAVYYVLDQRSLYWKSMAQFFRFKTCGILNVLFEIFIAMFLFLQ